MENPKGRRIVVMVAANASETRVAGVYAAVQDALHRASSDDTRNDPAHVRTHATRRHDHRRSLVFILLLASSVLASPVRADGWAVGQATVLRSVDLGETWTRQDPKSSAALNSVYFLDNQRGWIAGGQVILKTTDGGSTWIDRYTDGGVLRSVQFVDGNRGWAVGSAGTIVKSINGGDTWTPQISNSSAELNSVYFIDASRGWVAGGQVLLKTTDGGISWLDKYSGGAVLRSVYFVDADTGWAVGSTGTILKTTNGGESWDEQTSNVSVELQSVYFRDASTGWVAGGQVILKTTDGGASWADQYSGGAALQSLHFLDGTTGWSVGTAGAIEKSTSAGDAWSPRNSGTSVTLTSVIFRCQDRDGDGYGNPVGPGCSSSQADCNDNDSSIHPGASEVPFNGTDENCDGADACYRNRDGDGYGSSTTIPGNDFDCTDSGESSRSGDCDDNAASVYPGAPETPANGIDEDCNGTDDCYRDQDGDGLGSSTITAGNDMDCSDAGESRTSTDCNDALATCLADCSAPACTGAPPSVINVRRTDRRP